MEGIELKGFKQLKAFDVDGNPITPIFEDGYIYFVRCSKYDETQSYIHLNGKDYGIMNGIDCGEV